MQYTIGLIGDSTLDNYVWVKNSESDTVKGQLASMLKKKLTTDVTADIVDFSVDGFTTKEVLEGGAHNKIHPGYGRTNTLHRPIDELAKRRDITHVVLSVGGNDIREKLSLLSTTLNVSDNNNTTRLNALNLFNQKLNDIIKEIQQNYIKILDELKKANRNLKLIIMLQYMVDSNNDAYNIYALMNLINQRENGTSNTQQAVKKLQIIMQRVYTLILSKAKKEKIPVIDLASSFDHTDPDLYVRQIEPSKKGSALIANLISEVLLQHDFNQESVIYSKSSIESTLNKKTMHEQWSPNREPIINGKSFSSVHDDSKRTDLDNYKEQASKLRDSIQAGNTAFISGDLKTKKERLEKNIQKQPFFSEQNTHITAAKKELKTMQMLKTAMTYFTQVADEIEKRIQSQTSLNATWDALPEGKKELTKLTQAIITTRITLESSLKLVKKGLSPDEKRLFEFNLKTLAKQANELIGSGDQMLYSIGKGLLMAAATISLLTGLFAVVGAIPGGVAILPFFATYCGFGLAGVIAAGTTLSAGTAATIAGATVLSVPTAVCGITGATVFFSSRKTAVAAAFEQLTTHLNSNRTGG